MCEERRLVWKDQLLASSASPGTLQQSIVSSQANHIPTFHLVPSWSTSPHEQNKNPPLFTNSGNSVGRQRRVEESETLQWSSSARRGCLALSLWKPAAGYGRGESGDPGLNSTLWGTRQVTWLTYRQPHSETSEPPSNSTMIKVHELNKRREAKEVPRVMKSLVWERCFWSSFSSQAWERNSKAVFQYHIPEFGRFIHSLIPSPGVMVM